MGHLVFGERSDWMPRVRILLEKGETRPFDPFDRFAQLNLIERIRLKQLLDDFACLRRDNLAALTAMNLQQESLEPTRKAPSIGSGNAIGTSGDLGRSRSHSSTSTFPSDGPPIS